MCACSQGFLGGSCSISGTLLGSTSVSLSINKDSPKYGIISPIELDHYIEFTFTICLSQP
jgi:hypothetical protein